MNRRRPRSVALWTAVLVLGVAQLLGSAQASAQAPYIVINGVGSSWSANALDGWRRNVQNLYGMTVNYDPQGSSVGRARFRDGNADFAVSEIEYGLTDGGVTETPPQRGYAYMPIVAGGTAFMYNLKIGNNRVTNLRLSGETIAKIFSRQITTWSDPAIAADNPGLTLPARPIVPVVRSDGSGTTAQLTRYLAARYGAIWDSYCGRANCGFTSNFPVKPGVEAKAGSQGVANFVAQDTSEGSITYVEYSYARLARFPVVKMLNEAGFYIEPTASSVAVALTRVAIRDDLTSELGGVYTNPDPRTYPLSSYSYMILPTDDNGGRFTPDKGRTLADFAYYFLCEGQQQADALGYSPLPINLVQAGVRQVARIPGTTNKLTENNLAGCNNPTLSPDGSNRLATSAAQPSECDKKGAAAQCSTGTAGAADQQTPTRPGGGISQVAAEAAGTNGGSGAGGAGGGGPGAASDPAAAGDPAATGAVIDPETGEIIGGAIDPATGLPVDAAGTALASNVSAIPVTVGLPDDGRRIVLGVVAVVLLLVLVLGPPLASRRMSRRGSAT